MQIAIDGPAGAGKSTIARDMAAALSFRYVDTGMMYRALAWALEKAGIPTDDHAAVAAALPGLDMEVTFPDDVQVVTVNGHNPGEEVRTAEAAMGASNVAVFPEVREKLVALQRETASRHDVIMDGRDIGTCVLPDADFKFFVTASAHARALRRQGDLEKLGRHADLQAIEEEIRERDAQDMNRAAAPLRRTDDQILIDTTHLTQQQAAEQMLAIIRKAK